MSFGALGFLEEVYVALQTRGMTYPHHAEQLAVALQQKILNPYPVTPAYPPPPPATIVDWKDCDDMQFIHEGIRRGYAVMRLPNSPKALEEK